MGPTKSNDQEIRIDRLETERPGGKTTGPFCLKYCHVLKLVDSSLTIVIIPSESSIAQRNYNLNFKLSVIFSGRKSEMPYTRNPSFQNPFILLYDWSTLRCLRLFWNEFLSSWVWIKIYLMCK
ncbi:hypothetical protein MARINOS108_11034 [Marinoscillum sp. 108]|nr:hypothetical protein MARINOS108_11034 [Marinoscillum sp. 108]